MNIRILTSCTGKKRYEPDAKLLYRDFIRKSAHIHLREEELSEYQLPARDMYTGQQHIRLLRGIEYIRRTAATHTKINLSIMSAGYGIVHEDHVIAPYECSFNQLTSIQSKELASRTGVVRDFRNFLAEESDYTLILLGNSYLRMLEISPSMSLGGRTIFLASEGFSKRLKDLVGATTIALSNRNTRQFSCGLVGLKGEIAARILKAITLDNTIMNRLVTDSSSAIQELTEIDVK